VREGKKGGLKKKKKKEFNFIRYVFLQGDTKMGERYIIKIDGKLVHPIQA